MTETQTPTKTRRTIQLYVGIGAALLAAMLLGLIYGLSGTPK